MDYLHRHEQKTGADLSGSSGDENRTIELSNDDAVFPHMQILISGAILQPITDFTLDVPTNTLTFVNKVWDDQVISIDYLTKSTNIN